jgi:hypothetical protein
MLFVMNVKLRIVDDWKPDLPACLGNADLLMK